MKRLMIRVICASLAFILAAALASCGKTGAQSGIPTENIQVITFPAYQSGKDDFAGLEEYINAIYDTPPFDVNIVLPAGWSVKFPEDGENTQAYAFFTIVNIYNGENYAGYIGFNKFQPYTGEIPQEDYYKTVYPELRLSSMFGWEPYTAVKATPSGETGIAEVWYLDPDEIDKHPGAMAEVPVIETLGILSYDKDLKVYIGIQFVPSVVTESEARDIAQSVELTEHK